jgi:sarcosine oxidase subunit gamma
MENGCVSDMLEPVLAASLASGRYGRERGAAGLRLRIVSGRALVQVMARGRSDDALKQAVRSKYTLDLPDKSMLVRGPRLSLLWAGYRTWMAMANEAEIANLESVVRDDIGAFASVSDQSDGRLLVELNGPRVREALAKLVPVDLHPRAFRPGDTALTLFGHIAGQITQVDPAPTYELMVFRGYADSFLHDITACGAEFGIDAVAGRGDFRT